MARAASNIRNMIPLNRLNIHTPSEVWRGYPPDVANLRIIGSRAFVYVPDGFLRKLDKKCVEGVLVGYDFGKYTHRVWIPGTKTVHSSPNVQIIESLSPSLPVADCPSSSVISPTDPIIQSTDSPTDNPFDNSSDCIASRTRSKSTTESTPADHLLINSLSALIDLTTRRHSFRWLALRPSAYFLPLLHKKDSVLASLTLKRHSSMASWKRKFTWCNLKGLTTTLAAFVVYTKAYMVWSRRHVPRTPQLIVFCRDLDLFVPSTIRVCTQVLTCLLFSTLTMVSLRQNLPRLEIDWSVRWARRLKLQRVRLTTT